MTVEDLERLARIWVAELSDFIAFEAMHKAKIGTHKDAGGCSERMTLLFSQLAKMPPHQALLLGLKIQEFAGPGSHHEEALMRILALVEEIRSSREPA